MNELGHDSRIHFYYFQNTLLLSRPGLDEKHGETEDNDTTTNTHLQTVCLPTELYLINKSKRANLKLGKFLWQKRRKEIPNMKKCLIYYLLRRRIC